MMVIFLSRDQILSIRNGADALIRQFLSLFGIWGIYFLSIAFIIGFTFAFLGQKKKWSFTSVRGDYLLWMLLEGTVWGIVLYIVLTFLPMLLMFPSGKDLVQQIVLAIGAGLYEEFLFRVILINTGVILLRAIFQWSRIWCLFIAVIISAGIFSSFHFFGAFGEPFDINTFSYRFFAGILLGTLYVTRGFGITAYAHMIYDFIVVFHMTTLNT